MPDFRYDQFCPLARASEVLGERWTLLIVRELMMGPQRFSDLRRRLPGVSTSVLSSRLRTLEERDIVSRRQLPRPAASTILELTELGRALQPVVIAMAAWGIRLMEPPRPGDHFEPSWVRLVAMTLRSPDPSPEHSYELRCPDIDGDVVIHVAGGPGGTRVYEADAPGRGGGGVDAVVRADAQLLLGVATGRVDPVAALEAGDLELTGDVEALRDLPALFSVVAALSGRTTANAPTEANDPPKSPSPS